MTVADAAEPPSAPAASAAGAAASAGAAGAVPAVPDAPLFEEVGAHILVTVRVNGHRVCISKRNLQCFEDQDPYLFDSDYTIAGSTGFLLWEANWLLLRLLRGQLGQQLVGKRVLELGSGTGLAGLCAAAAGAHVLLTDLASVCMGSLRPNLSRNEGAAGTTTGTVSGGGDSGAGSSADGAAASSMGGQDGTRGAAGTAQGGCSATASASAPPAPPPPSTAPAAAAAAGAEAPWRGAVAVGSGSAAVMPLDWTEPLEVQAKAGGSDPRDASVILAVDTIWLKDIFHCFLDVVLAVLRHPRSAGAVTAAGCEAAVGASEPSPGEGQQAPGGSREGPCGSGCDAAAGQQGPARAAGCEPPKACYLAFVERAGEASTHFVRKEDVEREFRARGCEVQVVLAEDVDVDGTPRPGRVLRVTLAHGAHG